ncbi:hypothetical protein [Sphingomonas sp. UYP23]
MTESSVWMVDQLTAAKVVRELDLNVTESQMRHLAELLAEHRINTLDLGVSRVQSKISDAIQDVLSRHRHMTSDWSDGCRFAEAAIYTATLDAIREMKPKQQRSKGQVLRSFLRQARTAQAAAAPIFMRIEAPSSKGSAGSANGAT